MRSARVNGAWTSTSGATAWLEGSIFWQYESPHGSVAEKEP